MSPYHGLDKSMRNKESSGNDSSAIYSSEARGRSIINLENTKDFLALGVVNTKSNLERMTTHLE